MILKHSAVMTKISKKVQHKNYAISQYIPDASGDSEQLGDTRQILKGLHFLIS